MKVRKMTLLSHVLYCFNYYDSVIVLHPASALLAPLMALALLMAAAAVAANPVLLQLAVIKKKKKKRSSES